MILAPNNKGKKLWQAAKQIIPGGNQLLSKRAEMFLPDHWPAYYKKAQGCEIWDLDDNHYYDFSIMGIGTCSLGYAHPVISNAVINAVKNGSMTSLNCYEEVELAQQLLALHPWADNVRFARSGGEACAIGVRIARAYAGKDKIAFCGYHGWHDWYLASNIQDKENLDEQLLPGLAPAGVPKHLSGSVLPFREGDIEGFHHTINQHAAEVGVVIMEIFRHQLPDLEFIKEIRRVCTQHGIVLIFDEVSSGFRLNIGGAHLLWQLEPDLCILGKALGNGHPISAIIGKQSVMQAAQDSFISSSYWSERVGFCAGLAVLEIFKSTDVISILKENGHFIINGLKSLIDKYIVPVNLLGIETVIILEFEGENALEMKTFFTQEMLKQGFLASNVIYISIAHSKELAAKYFTAVEKVFSHLSHYLAQGNLETKLDGPVCHSGFERLN